DGSGAKRSPRARLHAHMKSRLRTLAIDDLETHVDDGVLYRAAGGALEQHRGSGVADLRAIDADGADRDDAFGRDMHVAETEYGKITRHGKTTRQRLHDAGVGQPVGCADHDVGFSAAVEI